MIVVAILIVIWPFLVPANVTEIIKWFLVAVLIIVGLFLLIKKES
ncbi:MAG: hypothetical protein ACP5C3_01235 [Methanomicrobiales archaeon]